MLRTPDRIDGPPTPELMARHARERRPLWIRDAFRGQKIAELSRLPQREAFAKTCRILDGMPLPVVEEYSAHLLSSPRDLTTTVPMGMRTLDQYLAFIERNPYSRRLCSEVMTPRPILDLIEIPGYLGPAGEWVSKLFLGNRGNHAHLHYDFDFRQVLFHQTIGRKRVVVIPVEETWKLMPILNFSSYFLENLRESEKLDFLAFANAYDVTLEPGDSLYMPALCWHYLEYTDTCMSVAIRYGRAHANSRIKELLPAHMTSEAQIAGACIASDPERWDSEARAIIAEAEKRHAAGAERFRAVQNALRPIAARMIPELYVRHSWRGHAEVIEENHIAGSYDHDARAAA